jgi:hypothetical protein
MQGATPIQVAPCGVKGGDVGGLHQMFRENLPQQRKVHEDLHMLFNLSPLGTYFGDLNNIVSQPSFKDEVQIGERIDETKCNNTKSSLGIQNRIRCGRLVQQLILLFF